MRFHIGGSLGWGERVKILREKIWPLEPVRVGWPHQCRCGESEYVKYRAYFYCYRCGKRILYPDRALMPGYTETFRETFTRKEAEQQNRT